MQAPSRQRRLLAVALPLSVLILAACGPEPKPPAPAKSPAPSPAQTAPRSGLLPPWPPLGKATTLAAQPAASNYYVVLDASGSMNADKCAEGSSKIAIAKKAVAEFAASLKDNSNFGLLAFDGRGVAERIPLGPARAPDLGKVLDRIAADGGTPLQTAISKAYDALTQQGQRQLGYGEYHLVVVTDGEFTPADENPTRIVAAILDKSPVVIHTVGFCIDAQHSLNQPGRILYSAANSPQELVKGLQSVLAESPAFAVSSFKP